MPKAMQLAWLKQKEAGMSIKLTKMTKADHEYKYNKHMHPVF